MYIESGLLSLDFVDADCPNCGSTIKLSVDLRTGSCEHCGSVYIIEKDKEDDQGSDTSISCPMCQGRGLTRCIGTRTDTVRGVIFTYEVFVEACMGDGMCHVTTHPEKRGISTNYCVSGKCAWCRGTGRTILGACKFCGGLGSCRICGGSGRCTMCKGEGLIRCKACRGKGYNRYRWRY